MPGVLAETPTPAAPTRRLRDAVGFVALGLGLGALAGVVWWLAADLPAYLVNQDGEAATTERDLTRFIAADAWFALLGAVVGVALGVVGWLRLRSIGWPVALLVVFTAVVAALVCWLVGHQLGPDNFARRLTAAPAGARVPIELTLRTKTSLLVWPFLAVLPVLLGSSLGRDEEEPRPLFREPVFSRARLGRWRRADRPNGPSVSQRRQDVEPPTPPNPWAPPAPGSAGDRRRDR